MKKGLRGLLLPVLVLLLGTAYAPLEAQTTPWVSVGDVLVGVGNGRYLHYAYDPTHQSYSLAGTITVGASKDQTSGCAFDSQLNFYATDTTAGQVFELNGSTGSVVQTLQAGVGVTSVMFDASGNLYVGIGGVTGTTNPGLLKYAPSLPANNSSTSSTATFTYPTIPTASYNVGENSDWIDLSRDQKTLYLTGETSSILTEDLSASLPVPNTFSTPSSSEAFAIRLLAPFDGTGGFLVADSNEVLKLGSTGAFVAGYSFRNSRNLQALTLDPNGTSAWVADFKSGNLYRFNINTGHIEVTISTPGWARPNGVCVDGGPELNVAPLVYNAGSNVSATAEFGAPGTANYHTWQATIGSVLKPFVMVVTATEGIDPARFSDYFPGQTISPIPYADGKPVVYRVANPPSSDSYGGSLFINGTYTYPTSHYTPPNCSGYQVPDPRVFRAPSGSPTYNINFQYDFTEFTDAIDQVWGGGSHSFNDYVVADRCPSVAGSSATFLSPLGSSTPVYVNLGSSLPISISAVNGSGQPITDAVTYPNNLTLSITLTTSNPEQPLILEQVYGVPGNSPDFFKITSDDKYKANLDTTGLLPGFTTLCVTSVDMDLPNGVGTATGPGEFPPVCQDIILQ